MKSNRMSSILSCLRGPLGQVLAIALLAMAAGGAHASGSRGTQLDNYCATKAPASSPPQQSRPYRASNNSCALCHPNGQNTASSLNTLGRAVDPCSGSGALATACQATTDPFCINTAPRSEAITQPTGNVSVATGTAVGFQGTAIDPDGFPLSFTWRFSNGLPDVNTTGTAVSTAQTSATSVTFLNAGTVTTTLQARDANQALAPTQPTRQVTVTAPTNQAPNGTIDAPTGNVSVVQGGTVNFQGTGTDPENSALTYLWNFGGGAANSTVQDPGNVTFNTVGTFTVTFTVTDAQGAADASPATRTVTVTAPPALAISPTSLSVTVGSTATSAVSNAVGAVTATSANTGIATASYANGVVTVAGVAAGSTTVAVRDSRSNAVTQTLNVTVTAAAQPLAISPSSVSVPVGSSATSSVSNAVGAVTATSANTAIATASYANGVVTVNGVAAGSTTVAVRDSRTNAVTQTLSVTVTAVTPPLAISPTSVSVGVGSTATTNVSNAVGAVTATSANTAVATASFANGVVTVTGVAAGSTTVAVRDSRSNAVTQTLNVTVTALPLAISPTSVSVAVAGSVTSAVSNAVGAITATSANTSIATASVVNNSVIVSGVAAGSTTVTVRDSRTATQTLSVTVTAPVLVGCRDADRDGYSPDGGACGPRDCNDNNAAVNPGAREVCGDGLDNDCDGQTDAADRECNGTDCLAQFFARPVVITSASWDSDDDGRLRVRGNQADAGGAVTIFNAATGALVGTTTTRTDGTWSFTREHISSPPCVVRVEINDATAERVVSNAPNCGTQPPANRPPVATITAPASNVTVARGGAVDFAGSGSDPDGNPLTYSWTFNGATPASATVADPAPVTFSTAGTFTVTFTVRDSLGATASATRTVTVTAPNPPVVNANSYTAVRGSTLTVAAPGVLGNDASNPAGRPLTARLVSSVNSVNRLTFNSDGSFAYTPASTFTGTDRFTYQALDAGVASATATVTITVVAPLPINRAEWDDGELDVRGSGAAAGATVILRNASTGAEVARTTASSTGTWRFDVRRLAAPPCTVRVESGNRFGTRNVSDAPSNCVR